MKSENNKKIKDIETNEYNQNNRNRMKRRWNQNTLHLIYAGSPRATPTSVDDNRDGESGHA